MTEEELDFTDAQILRDRAEELVVKSKRNASFSEIELVYDTLLYELKVQQTQLELQNKAMRQANETAEIALKKYTMLYDLAAMGYFLLGPDGTISELNTTGAGMLCERHFPLKGTNFKLFVSDASKTEFNNFFQKSYKSHALQSCKIHLSYDGKPLCRVYIEGIVNEGELNCLLSVVNLSILKHFR